MLLGAIGLAQPAAAQRVVVTPSIGLTRMYDDNIFYRTDAEADSTTRLSPRLDIVDDTGRSRWTSHYELDADRFDRHPELTTPIARQDAAVDGRYNISRRVAVSGGALFLASQTPVDLVEQASLTPGRARAERVTVRPSVEYDVDGRTHVAMTVDVTHDRLDGGIAVLTQTATSTVDRHISPRSTLGLEYAFQRFTFNGTSPIESQTATVTWGRDVSRAAHVSVRVGPRLTDGVFSPEVAASLRYRLRAAEAGTSYTHTTTTLLGLAGVADTHLWTVNLAFQGRRARWHAAPSVLHTTEAGLASVAYRLSAGWTQPLGSRLAVDLSYDGNRQRGRIYSPVAVDTISRNRVLLTLIVTDAAGRAIGASR